MGDFCFAQGETVARAFPLGLDPTGKRFGSKIAFLPTPLDLASEDGGLTVLGESLVMNIEAGFTAGITPGLYPYDVFMPSLDGGRAQVASGMVRVAQAVTPIS